MGEVSHFLDMSEEQLNASLDAEDVTSLEEERTDEELTDVELENVAGGGQFDGGKETYEAYTAKYLGRKSEWGGSPL
jgi:hypothetical protein